MSLVELNGAATVPGVHGFYRERDLSQVMDRLELKALQPPLLVNLRDDDGSGDAWRRSTLSEAELDYFRRRGNNATLIIHGYNVPFGGFPAALRPVEAQQPGQGVHPGPIQRVSTFAEDDAEAGVYRGTDALKADFPDRDWGSPATARFEDESEFNGEGAVSWLLAMEHTLNRAAAGGAVDWSQYQRLLGVAWSGDFGALGFWDGELGAARGGRRLVPLLEQLADAGLAVNLIAHSLGARVVLTALNILGQRRNEPVVDQVFLWEPAVANTALTNDPARDVSPLKHDHFPDAHTAAGRMVILFSEYDGILGPPPDGGHDDGPGETWLDHSIGELDGAYPKKYWMFDDIAEDYLPGYRPWAYPPEMRERVRQRQLQKLYEDLRDEARRVNAATEPGKPLPDSRQLEPWGRENRYSDEEVRNITDWLTAILDHRDDIPNIVAPAMGWRGPQGGVGDPFVQDLIDRGIVDPVNQHDLLQQHSGMKYPSERLFDKIYREEVMDRIKEKTGFGVYK
jgi:hypothetical protein